MSLRGRKEGTTLSPKIKPTSSSDAKNRKRDCCSKSRSSKKKKGKAEGPAIWPDAVGAACCVREGEEEDRDARLILLKIDWLDVSPDLREGGRGSSEVPPTRLALLRERRKKRKKRKRKKEAGMWKKLRGSNAYHSGEHEGGKL